MSDIRSYVKNRLNEEADEKYRKIFKVIEKIKTEDYYAKMAVAWLISICFIKFPQKTMTFLQLTKIQD